MKKGLTRRGFDIITFEDRYRQECSLQKSSIATEDCIWLGVENTGPDISGPHGERNEDVVSRMHLTQDQVKELIPYLEMFVLRGDF